MDMPSRPSLNPVHDRSHHALSTRTSLSPTDVTPSPRPRNWPLVKARSVPRGKGQIDRLALIVRRGIEMDHVRIADGIPARQFTSRALNTDYGANRYSSSCGLPASSSIVECCTKLTCLQRF